VGKIAFLSSPVHPTYFFLPSSLFSFSFPLLSFSFPIPSSFPPPFSIPSLSLPFYLFSFFVTCCFIPKPSLKPSPRKFHDLTCFCMSDITSSIIVDVFLNVLYCLSSFCCISFSLFSSYFVAATAQKVDL
jgi:hypothetical protein